MVGYEVYFGRIRASSRAPAAGYDGPRELSGWYTAVYHTLDIAPGNVTGGSATLQRVDGVQINGDFSGGDVAQTNPGDGCTDRDIRGFSRADERGAHRRARWSWNRNAQCDVDALQGVGVGRLLHILGTSRRNDHSRRVSEPGRPPAHLVIKGEIRRADGRRPDRACSGG